jgi:hypothetical protein
MSLGGYVTSDPAATSRAVNTIEVFVRGGDGALWSRNTTDDGTHWTPWTNLGGQLLAGTGPAAYSWGILRTGVFVTGTNHALWHMWSDNEGLHGWVNLGGYLTSSPGATGVGNMTTGAQIGVFGQGKDGALWWKQFQGNPRVWSSWTSLGGQIAANTGPAACSYGIDREDVFVEGTNGALYHKWKDTGAWSGWENVGGKSTASPAAASSGDNTIDVFVRGGSGRLWSRNTTNGGINWNPWYELPA